MEYLIGILLALGICLGATVVGLARDRAFYPTMAIVIALYYALFAMIGDSMRALMPEMAGIAVFVLLAVVGFRRNLWYAVGALALHGVFDWFHAGLIANPGVPGWWPGFCLAFDVVAAAILAVALLSRRVFARPDQHARRDAEHAPAGATEVG
jgi:hypothetical protein